MPINPSKIYSILLSLANPNGINPTKPPTATFVSPLWEDVKAPIKTIIRPMNIITIPNDIKFWAILRWLGFLGFKGFLFWKENAHTTYLHYTDFLFHSVGRKLILTV